MTDEKSGPGRPSRSSSPADKRISIRFTAAEHAAIEKAASPSYVSDWIRKKILGTGSVIRALGNLPARTEADLAAKLAELTAVAEKFGDEDKGDLVRSAIRSKFLEVQDVLRETLVMHQTEMKRCVNVIENQERMYAMLEAENEKLRAKP